MNKRILICLNLGMITKTIFPILRTLLPPMLLAANGALARDLSTKQVLKPHIQEGWWQIAGDPDLGELTSSKQQPVDFAIWQAADGKWQLWSCIRSTKETGNTRLLYSWEGEQLTNSNWKPKGVAMRADAQFGERPGGLQAPFVCRDGKRFVMLYGSWDHICSAFSTDGKQFQRHLNSEGKAPLFGESSGNTRDPMLVRIGDLWHCYYSAHPQDKGADYCRTSSNLLDWSPARVVARAGQAGEGPYSAECPFVVELEPGKFYLFRTQHYGANAKTSVYFSRDPLDFGLNNDKDHFVCTLPVAAPEIIYFDKQWYIAALLPSLNGIQIARLTWEK